MNSMKHITQFINVSLKYFFDIDFRVVAHFVAFLLVILYMLKTAPALILKEFHEGLLTIKADIAYMKDNFYTFKEKWGNSEMHGLYRQFVQLIHVSK